MNLGFKIQKTNLGIRIRILKIQSLPIFRQNGQILLSWPKFDQKWIFSSKLRKQMLKQESASSRYHVCQLIDKTNNFDFFDLNLPRKEYHVYQFLDNTDNFEFFGPNFSKTEIRF